MKENERKKLTNERSLKFNKKRERIKTQENEEIKKYENQEERKQANLKVELWLRLKEKKRKAGLK